VSSISNQQSNPNVKPSKSDPHEPKFPLPAHTFTAHESAMGGGAMTLAKKLGQRIYCFNSCPIYPCYLQPLSAENPDAKYKYQRYFCGMRQMAPRMKQRYYRLHALGAEGLLEEMRDALMEMKERIGGERAVQELAIYFDKLERLADRLYPQGKPGSTLTVKHEGEVEHKHEHTVTLNRIVEEFAIIEGDTIQLEDDADGRTKETNNNG
jgi:hypothetical protein